MYVLVLEQIYRHGAVAGSGERRRSERDLSRYFPIVLVPSVHGELLHIQANNFFCFCFFLFKGD
jgi:hypothetical protein